MSISLTTLRSELREHLGVDPTELPNANADLLLNRSFWEILNKFNFRETEQSATFSTIVGDDFYSTPSLFEAIRLLSIKGLDSDSDDKWEVLDQIEITEHESELNTSVDARGKPEKYCREDGGYRLLPIPDKVYLMRVKYWITLEDLSDTNFDVVIPTAWHEIILLGGIWRGLLRQRNLVASREVKNHQIILMNSTIMVEEKELEDNPRGGVSVPIELFEI